MEEEEGRREEGEEEEEEEGEGEGEGEEGGEEEEVLTNKPADAETAKPTPKSRTKFSSSAKTKHASMLYILVHTCMFALFRYVYCTCTVFTQATSMGISPGPMQISQC